MASSLSPLLCLLFLLSYPFVLAVFGLNEEGLSLLSFKASIKEDPAGSLTNWSSADSNPCSWHGITCKQGKVVSVSIPMKRLEGFISPSLGSLSNLRHLNLRKNKLHGKLSSELFGAQRLQSLVLSGNSLSGSLPNEIGDLSYLQNLDLSNNSFNGSLPNSLIQCKRLRTLVLSHNNFSSSLPRDFGRSFVQLEKLDLSYNRLIGLIPQDIGNLSNLQGTADFSHNLFSGPIPASLGDLPEKVYIDLTYNNLSGPIPPDGPLENRGPTAFIGNPGLCGPPLKNPCSDNVSGVGPYLPINYPPPASESGDDSSRSSSRGLSRNAVAAIVASDVAGLSLIAIVFFHCYKRAMSSTGKEGGGSSDKGLKGRKECTCFRKDESEALSDNVEHLDLIPLDNQLGFNLDELLKSSAFVLGKSRMGIVYKVVLEDGLTMAVRRLGEGGSQRLKEFQAEVEAIGKIRHPNIVTLRAYFWSIDEKLLIYDYIPNGNLSTAIHGKAGMVSFQPLSWVVRLNIMKGIAKGLAFLHDISPKKYVHGDLKPNNILLGLHMEPYISDFGVGRLASIAGGSPLLQSNRTATEKSDCQQSEIMASPVIRSGTCYQAPEALKSLKPSQKWDVYSYGVILVELISGRSPALLGTSEMDLAQWIQCHIEEKKLLFDILDPFLASEKDRDDIIPVVKIALACVQANPERRPPMRSVVDTLERLVNGS